MEIGIISSDISMEERIAKLRSYFYFSYKYFSKNIPIKERERLYPVIKKPWRECYPLHGKAVSEEAIDCRFSEVLSIIEGRGTFRRSFL